MDAAQRKAAVDIKITRCANHGTHKVCEASVKNETELLKQLMGGAGPGDRAATELVDLPGIIRDADPCAEELDQPTAVGAVIRATSKLFAPEGEHGGYHLNEWAILVAWQKGHSDPLIRNFKLESLPSFKGSRQMILLELAAAIAKNRWLYVRYLKSQRQEGAPNKLVTAVLMGLSNKYVVAAHYTRGHTLSSPLPRPRGTSSITWQPVPPSMGSWSAWRAQWRTWRTCSRATGY